MKRERIDSIYDVLDKSALLSIGMMSIFSSLLYLGIPIAAQTLINLIAFGKLLQPLLTLSIIVFILMIALGLLHIWQAVIIEIIQQKLMVKLSLALTRQFTHLSLDAFSSHHGPELVNRYFEIVSINKSLANLLLYGINLGLQLFFGLLLLLLYHPIFLAYDLLIIIGILLIIFIPYKKASYSAKQECSQKHEIGAWLEEILINRFLFRFNSYHHYANQQTDKKLVGFLKARNIHFKQLIKHQIGFYFLSALASSLLLGVGGYLVIQNQLSLGQLVAAELVLGALIYAFKRFGALMENYYDLISSSKKIDDVLSLSNDSPKGSLPDILVPVTRIGIKFSKNQAQVTPDRPLEIYSENPESCEILIQNILGFTATEGVEIFVNDIKCSQVHLVMLRRYSLFLEAPQWFAGSIYDNLVLNHRFEKKIILEKLRDFELLKKIMELPEELDTVIYDWQSVFTEMDMIKLMIIRTLLLKPQILVVNRTFDLMDKNEINGLIEKLLTLKDTILILVTHNPEFHYLDNHLVLNP
ncbi:ABC transporter transmembrane domain-containing protein [Legionella hackeliae]|uniref:Toxin secretion ABC transporter HlyB/MsbA family ATP-binding protein n=1 Tax=Legionella hackeliae TaxID=449 RepID=A0A0A8URY6_LEGHA|nr:ABC transporter transmembrane domain-containing protein [Legionella hackeliae]KTD13189.1 toxin secretion ABC transporter HlyB/MsbA family transporter ATP-binding protein [Legionella hackeliae]CEK11498.1 Toxin secretion ABC transporter HlyB/MsbA family ATP-binding protein [Legionella hackeliae]STX48266.1 toxin secretion ABC transporter HlyB/MsbA family ATP-binding protein [Legionella hackeliae]